MATLWTSSVPDLPTALGAGGLGLLTALPLGYLAGRLRAAGIAVAYTRKIFHFGVFTMAALVHSRWGLPGTNSFGVAVALVVLWAVFRGEGHAVYEALARDKDRPRRSLFILAPLLTTAVGGLASALLAGPVASVGYLVAGWGDAVGEPVGARWGRHPYRVPSLGGVAATRTIEGSVAVFLASWLGAGAVLWTMTTPGAALTVALACALGATVVEAASHHGLDNLTVQLSASLTALWLLG